MHDREREDGRFVNAGSHTGKAMSLLLLLSALATTTGGAEQVIRHEEFPGFLARVVVVPRDDFTVERIEAIARHFLTSERARPGIVRLRIYADKNEITVNCKCVTDVTYELWWYLYQHYAKSIRPVAELLSINGNASVQVRDLNGRIHRKVLAGTDPLAISVPGCHARVLFVGPSFHSGRRGNWPHFTFYLRSDTVSTSCAEQAREKLVELLGSDDISAYLRKDAWFIDSDEFPVAYAFDEDTGPPPSKEAYRNSPEAWCTLIDTGVRCGIRPQ